jgi:hypothetical protein
MDARIRKGTTIRLPSFVSVQKCRIVYCSLEITLDKRSISSNLEVWFQHRIAVSSVTHGLFTFSKVPVRDGTAENGTRRIVTNSQ